MSSKFNTKFVRKIYRCWSHLPFNILKCDETLNFLVKHEKSHKNINILSSLFYHHVYYLMYPSSKGSELIAMCPFSSHTEKHL